MTKEEALRKIKGYLTDLIPQEDYTEVEEIVKALEQQPCPYWDYGSNTCRHANIGALATKPCGDAVSREDSIKVIKSWFEKIELNPDILIDSIISLPSVQPKEDVLDKIKAEIESNMESIIGKYDSSIPKSNMPSYKIERNKAREECISIIDKYKADKVVEE